MVEGDEAGEEEGMGRRGVRSVGIVRREGGGEKRWAEGEDKGREGRNGEGEGEG